MKYTICSIALLLNAAGQLNAGEATVPQGANDPKLRAMSLKLVTAMFLVPDAATVEKLIDRNAERKDSGPGSALMVVREIEKKGREIAQSIRLREVHLFTSEELPEIEKRFPNLKFLEGDRVPWHVWSSSSTWGKTVSGKAYLYQRRLGPILGSCTSTTSRNTAKCR